jgi:multicomponent Na+:H+ antiporter subunit E
MLELLFFLCSLFAVWLIWSGIFAPMLLFFAVFSVLFILWLSSRMESTDSEHYHPHLGWRSIAYGAWLVKEIVVSALRVTRLVWTPGYTPSPRMGWVDASQASDEARVYYANSITLTPGTVSCDVEDKQILVHALEASGLSSLREGGMDKKVTWGFE